jgi:tetratricopeptide (TPR) repeat protein
VLDEVLLLEPAQPDALMMLGDLGYQVEGQPVYEEPPQQQHQQRQAAPPASQYDPNAPLPSYDLEEVSASDAMSLSPSSLAPEPTTRQTHRPDGNELHRESGRAADPFAQAQLDDPFAAEAPLPSFPIDDEATQFIQVPSAFMQARDEAARQSIPPAQLDEEALEEVEFFASHGMFDEAKNLLEEQIARLPNHPLLLERRRELEMMQSGAPAGDGSGTRAVPRPASQPEDRSFDIAASLDALDALDSSALAPAPSLADDPRQISVETVFEQFKAGVAAQISESDAGTHYDLGVAYREMGLFTDAVNEFDLASRDPARACVCQSMIGFIWRQMGNVEQAVDAFIRGLTASQKTHEQEQLLLYEIGDAYESWGAREQAYYYFQQLGRIEPGYQDPRGDIETRMRNVEPAHGKATGARAVGAEAMTDEFDAALDDLLDGTFPGGKV